MSSGGESDLLGRTIAGKYKIDSFLGGGAMGAVYKAHQLALEKTVAIKVMHKVHASEAMFAARFHREAKAASRIDHPNAMRVFDFGEEPDGLLYIAMELLDGQDLFQLVRAEWPITPARIVSLLGQALAALAVAHDMGVVHRDLKPENIMVLRGTDDEGRPVDIVKVCDFGIAKIQGVRSEEDQPGTAKLTAQGLVVGTPEYMSPEQGRGEPLDARSDLYSMGVILYQLLTGRVPFDAETALGIVLMHVTDEPRPPSQVSANVDPYLEAVCIKALRKKREERFQTSRELRTALRAAIGEVPRDVPPVSAGGGALGTAKTELGLAIAPTMALSAVSAPSSISGSGSGSSSTGDAPPSRDASASSAQGQGVGTAGALSIDGASPRRSRAPLAVAVGGLALAGLGAVFALTRESAPPVAAPVATMTISPPVPLSASVARPETAAPDLASAPTPSSTAGPVVKAAPTLARSPEGRPRGERPDRRGNTAPPSREPAATPEAPTPAVAEPAPPTPPPTAAPVVAPAAPASAPPAPPVAAPAPAAPPPPARPFQPERARVEITNAVADGVSSVKLKNALARPQSAWVECYRAALRANGAAAGGEATLRLTIDDDLRVRSATLVGSSFLPKLGACIEPTVRGVRITDADTGPTTANVTLSFRPE